MRHPLLTAATTALLTLAACQGAPGKPGPLKDDYGDPDCVVANLRDAHASTPHGNLYATYETECGKKLRSKAMLRRQSENLLFRHPDHVDARMLAALLAYEADDPAEAARHLDYVLRVDPATPDAALLRARIALEEGNPQLAKTLLDAQVELRPDHAGLREAHASALYLTGHLDEAREALDEAERLGAPVGRIAYNRGLIAEESGDLVLAAKLYEQALEDVPHWSLPSQRLRGIRAGLPFVRPKAPKAAPAGAKADAKALADAGAADDEG